MFTEKMRSLYQSIVYNWCEMFWNDCKILICIVISNNNNKYIGKGDDANGYEEKN